MVEFSTESPLKNIRFPSRLLWGSKVPKEVRIGVLGDLHAPWVHWKSVRRAISVLKELKPNLIVQVGDARDLYSFAKFPRSHNVITPLEELKRGTKCLEEVFGSLREACPRARVVMLMGNHDIRPHKRIVESAPENESLLGLFDYYKFEGVETITDDTWFYGGMCFTHGWRSKLGDHASHARMSVICGHSHRGGVVYMRDGKRTIWELNAGHLADPHTPNMSYAKQRTFATWTHGLGWIDSHGPRFIPL